MKRILHFLLRRFVSQSPLQHLVEEQSRAFSELGLKREEAIQKLKTSERSALELEKSDTNSMFSEHVVLFVAIALKNVGIEDILEIGTFQGRTTTLLSKLFPTANIETIDLSRTEILKNRLYAYGTFEGEFNREAIPNVTFVEMNSLKLLNSSKQYDLVWVDGNHLSPYSISDIVNSVRLLKDNGYVICDDIYIKKPFIEKNADLSSLSILRALSDAGVITFRLISKRLGRRYNNVISGRKFIAVVRRVN